MFAGAGYEDGEDWRVEAHVAGESIAASVVTAVHERAATKDWQRDLGDVAAISQHGSTVFGYTGTLDHAHEVEQVLSKALEDHGEHVSVEITHWHPVEERWEPVSEALPETAAETRAEAVKLRDEERAESAKAYRDLWQVHVEFPTRHEAVDYAQSLRAEGFRVIRRWRYLLVYTPSELDGADLIAKIKSETPDSSKVFVEGSEGEALLESDSFEAHRFSPLTYL